RGVDKVVEATIELAHSLGIEAIAEGVETSDQLDRLGALGCDAVQGFLLGRPVDADAFSLIIRDARWPGA
ncbi:MAG TPA: EAL domain-containing protein, partial [Acidimicrobiales bacterium]|nr:EAL domain-containing protein [Acidimicrobiales bacterium]